MNITTIYDSNGDAPLHLAAADPNGEKQVERLLAAGADPNIRTLKKGWTPLHIAVDRGHPDIVDLLLRAGADSNLTTDDGRDAVDLLEAQIRDMDHDDAMAIAESLGADLMALIWAEGA